ncbi:hypothetical protein AGLY_017241 [Aphis glycines]|uniref:Uncharacterized protein n=1 Tax=Aphis glycines TaxID=307491 RepID=A0A6G0SVH6_APHGL|nr:hypothetical protein AGLY_017241 [Aphis glycines]
MQEQIQKNTFKFFTYNLSYSLLFLAALSRMEISVMNWRFRVCSRIPAIPPGNLSGAHGRTATTYGKLCIELFILKYKHKQFYDFLTSKLLANFRDFDIFQKLIRNFLFNFKVFSVIQIFFIDTLKNILIKNENFSVFELQPYKIRFGRKLVLRKNSRFPSFFFVLSIFFENCRKMISFYLFSAPRIFIFLSETTLELCCTQTQKKKNKKQTSLRQICTDKFGGMHRHPEGWQTGAFPLTGFSKICFKLNVLREITIYYITNSIIALS